MWEPNHGISWDPWSDHDDVQFFVSVYLLFSAKLCQNATTEIGSQTTWRNIHHHLWVSVDLT